MVQTTFRLRKAMRAGNARAVVEDRLGDLFGYCRNTFRQWGTGTVLPGEMSCQRLIGDQIAQLSTSITPQSALVDELMAFEFHALIVHVLGALPKFTLRTPRMKRYTSGRP